MVWNINYKRSNGTFDGTTLVAEEGKTEEETYINIFNEILKERERLRIQEITELFPD